MVALIFLLVAVVGMLKATELAPAGTVTLAATMALVGFVLERVTSTGLDVILLRATVPTEVVPPTMVLGFNVREETTAGAMGAGAVTVTVTDLVTPA